jgi:hypothetical protein
MDQILLFEILLVGDDMLADLMPLIFNLLQT